MYMHQPGPEFPHDIPKFQCIGYHYQNGTRIFEYFPGVPPTFQNKALAEKVLQMLGGKGGFKMAIAKTHNGEEVPLITQLEVPHSTPDAVRRDIENLLFDSGFGEFDLSPDETAKRKDAVGALKNEIHGKLISVHTEPGFNTATDQEKRYERSGRGPYDTLFYRNGELVGARDTSGNRKSIYRGQRVTFHSSELVDGHVRGVDKQAIIGKFELIKGIRYGFDQLTVELESPNDHSVIGTFEVEKVIGPVASSPVHRTNSIHPANHE